MVLLVGGSGSGKSSVVRAGVLPALDRGGDGWSTTVMVPGSDPFRNLDAALARIRTQGEGRQQPGGAGGLAEAVADSRRHPILLVIDQLEELFTLAPRAQRDRFLDEVAAAVTAEGARFHVVATVRADYFDRPLDHPRFGALAGRTALPVPAMTPTQLALTITGPAEGRITIEEGLVADLVAATAREPAALPPLQFALHQLAESGGSVLRRSDLQGLGGVEGAIAQRAEELYSTLAERQRRLLRWVLTRLVVIGADGAAARTPVVRADLVGQSEDGPAVDALIESWIAGRLLVGNRRPDTREPTVELAHEAILEHWPRLGSWIDRDRERLLAVARLDDAAAQWRDVGRDPAALLRGARLEQAEETRRRSGRLAPLTAEFLDCSAARRDEEELAEAEAAMRRESTARRLRRQRVLLAAALVLALAIGGVAIDQRNSATRVAAQTAERARTAGSALAAASAEAIRSDWSVGLLLAAQAHRIDPSETSRQALIRAVVDPGPVPTTVFVGDRRYRTVEVDPVTGTIAARSTSGTVDLIDPDTRQRVAVIQALGSGGVAIHDGRVIVANRGDTRGSLIGYDEGQRAVVAQLPRGTYPTDIEFSPSAGQLAVADSGGGVTIYDPATWAVTHLLGAGSQAPVEQVAWDEAGDTLYALDARAELMVWSGLGKRAPGAGRIAPDRARNLNDGDAAWVPDYPLRRTSGFSFAELEPIPTTPLLVAAPVDGAPWAIDTRDLGTYVVSGGSSDWVRPAQLAVGPDSPVVYRADGSTWAASPELSVIAAGEEQPVAGGGTGTRWDAVDIAVTTLGTVVTVGSDGNVTLWELPGPVTGTQPVPTLDAAQGIVFSPRGDALVHWGPGAAATRIDARGYAGSRQLSSGDPGPQLVLGVAFQPELDRILLASCPGADPSPSAPCPGTLAAFDMTTGSLVAGPIDMGPQLGGPGSPVVAGPPLGGVATSDAAGSITLRDPATLESTRTLTDLAGRLLSRQQVSLHLHPDRPLLLADPVQGSGIVVWDLGPAEPVVAFESSEAQDAMFAPDGSLLVAEGLLGFPEWELQSIDTSTFAVLDEVGAGPGLLGQPSSASAGLMLTTDRVGSLWLWNTSEHRPMTTVSADRAVLKPDGSALLLWRGDRAHELSLADDHLLATACAAAGRNLTQQEWDRYLGAGEPYRTTCPDGSSPSAS
jgi:DNA-binding beta-propeller fold protein YncE